MSASTKKKLRSAEREEMLTQKQLKEQKEAKKLKLITTIFVVAIALMLCFAIVITAVKTVENSGIRERNTVALTLNDHEISNAELNYYYIDSINNFYSYYGSYAYLMGLDSTLPLDQQIIDEATGKTWADDFINSAVDNAKAVYALNDAAAAAGFVMSDSEKNDLEASIATMELYATYSYGYPDFETYLKTVYGHGASVESYREYCTMNYLADAYQNSYLTSLTYEDADLREAEADNYDAYTSYTYNYYYLNAQNLVEKDDSGNYTDEQYAEAVELAETYAKKLTDGINTVEALDAAIATLPMNAEVENAASTASKDVLNGSVFSTFKDWVTSNERQIGDVTYVPNTTTSTDDAGNETTKINGYYVVLFGGRNENNIPMANVRHILAAFEGGTTDELGNTVYSEEEKITAQNAATLIYETWKSGDATEESFAELANKESDDGDGTTGGLYENINPSTSFVTNFKNWALADHNPGDTEIIETEYGYHVMYYSGQSEMTYRDFMITEDLKGEALNNWYTELVNAVNAQIQDTKYMTKDLVLSSGQ